MTAAIKLMMNRTDEAIKSVPESALPGGQDALQQFRQQVFRAMVFFGKVEVQMGELPDGASKMDVAKHWLQGAARFVKLFMVSTSLLEQGEKYG